MEGTLGSLENAACCGSDFDDACRVALSLPRRRVALLFSLEEFTPLAGVVSSRREPSLGGTGGLEDEEEYRRWCKGRVAPSRLLVTFWLERVIPGSGMGVHAARRNDVDSMVGELPSH